MSDQEQRGVRRDATIVGLQPSEEFGPDRRKLPFGEQAQYLVLAHAVGRHGESEKVLGKALVPYEGEFAERKRRVRYGMAHANATKPYRAE